MQGLEQVFNLGTKAIDSAKAAAAQQGRAFGVGSLIGAGKSLVDIPALPVSVGASLLGHLTGNEGLRKSFDNYEEVWLDPRNQQGLTANAYKSITGQDSISPEEMQALTAGQVTSGVVASGLMGKLPKIGGLIKGGAIGAGGALLSNAPEALGAGKLRNLAAAAIPDDLVKGAAQLQKNASEIPLLKNVVKSRAGENAIAQLNPRSATERVIAEGQDVMSVLKRELNAPEAVNIKDLGDAYVNRFRNMPEKESMTILENRLKKAKASPESIALIKEELLTSVLKAKSTQSLSYAKQNLNNQLNKIGRSDTNVKPEEVLKAATNVVDFHNKEISNLYAKGNFEAGKIAEQSLQSNIEKVYESLKKKNPKLASEWVDSYNPAFSSGISRLSMMLNPGAAAQDVASFQLNSRNAVLSTANAAGIKDISLVEKNTTPFFKKDKWLENPANSALIRREVIEPTKGIMSGFDPLSDFKLKSAPVDIKNIKSIWDKAPDLVAKVFEDSLYGVQQGVREKLVETSILPKAIGIARATPGLIEGTPLFNKAVVNNAKELLRKTGMLKENKFSTAKNSLGGVDVDKSWESYFADSVGKMPVIGKDAKAAVNTLLGWTSNQMRAFNAAPDSIGDVLNRVQKTGQVSKLDKQLLVQSMSDIFFTAAMFGARGLRLSGQGFTIPKVLPGQNPMDRSTAEQTVPSLIVNSVLDLMNGDPDLRQQVLNGLMGNYLGNVPAAGLINAPDPITRIGLGADIAKAKISQWGNYVPEMIAQLSNGDIQGAVSSFANILASKDIKGIINTKTTGQIIDGKGNVVTEDFARNNNLTENTDLGKEAISLLKTDQPAIKDASPVGKLGSDYALSQDDKFVEKYSRYNIEQLTENLDSVLKDLQKFDPDAQEKIIEKTVKKIAETSAPSSFKSIKSKAGEYLELTTTELSQQQEIKQLHNNQLAEIVAYSGLMNTERPIEVLMKAGKLTDKNLVEVMDKANKIIERKQNEQVFKLLGSIGGEEEVQPEPETVSDDDEEFVEIPDDDEEGN